MENKNLIENERYDNFDYYEESKFVENELNVGGKQNGNI